MEKIIYIVIPVFNRKNFTRECLLSLRKQTYKNFKVIVVDDGSTDGTAEMLAKEFPEVYVIKGDGNLWWTGATNEGIKYALKNSKESDYILTLNNDLIVENNYLEKILEVNEKSGRCITGSISISAEDRQKVLDAGVYINRLTAKFNNNAEIIKTVDDLNKLNNCFEVDALPGRGTLIPVKVFEEIGIFNEKLLPHYGADYEFSIRAKKKGYKNYLSREVFLYSYVKETGLNNLINKLNWKEFLKSFFSIKSPNNLFYRWNFAKLCLEKRYLVIYYLMDTIRVISGSFRNQFINR